jgi:hypothetical protein
MTNWHTISEVEVTGEPGKLRMLPLRTLSSSTKESENEEGRKRRKEEGGRRKEEGGRKKEEEHTFGTLYEDLYVLTRLSHGNDILVVLNLQNLEGLLECH